ncbi:MAG: hypothetical protein E6772_14790 [Dysgonomonas sp.]|nr:hypothetical protein [Dysgonomonas sp.]
MISQDSSLINEEDLDYLINVLGEKEDYQFSYLLKSERLLLMTFSSIRKYTSSLINLIVINSQIGQIEGNEPIPIISLGDNIESAIYEEPILYHGNGCDVFYVRPVE